MSDHFTANSRYRDVPTVTVQMPDGTSVTYLKLRIVPPPEVFETIQEHKIVERDRLDNLAAKYLGDPELFWRLCDANGAIRPDELIETIGRRIRITLPQGIAAPPGVANG